MICYGKFIEHCEGASVTIQGKNLSYAGLFITEKSLQLSSKGLYYLFKSWNPFAKAHDLLLYLQFDFLSLHFGYLELWSPTEALRLQGRPANIFYLDVIWHQSLPTPHGPAVELPLLLVALSWRCQIDDIGWKQLPALLVSAAFGETCSWLFCSTLTYRFHIFVSLI